MNKNNMKKNKKVKQTCSQCNSEFEITQEDIKEEEKLKKEWTGTEKFLMEAQKIVKTFKIFITLNKFVVCPICGEKITIKEQKKDTSNEIRTTEIV